MAIDAGTLLVSIQADTARIKADMDVAKSVIGGAMKDVEQYVGYAKTALVGLIGFGSVKAFIGIIEGSIEAKSKLYDMSLQTGISVEALSALGKVAKYSNTDLADVAAASNKLSKALFTQNEDSKGAAQAIKALGLSFAEFKGLQADEQMLKVAKAMDQFQDGTGKSASAMLLYGRQGALLLPFLKELAEKNELVGKQTTESARQAKEYEDNLITMRAATEQWRRELTDFLLPALVGVTNELIDGKKAYGSYAAAFMDVLGGSQEVGGLAKTRDELAKLRKEMKDAESDAPSLLDKLFPKGTRAAGLADEIAQLEKREAFQKAQQAREALNAGRGITDRFDRPKAVLNLAAAAPDKNADRDLDAYNQLIKTINEKVALNKTEYESDVKITEVGKLRSKVLADIETGLFKLTSVQRATVMADLDAAAAWEKLNLQKEKDLKWFKEASEANANYVESQMLVRTQLQDQTKEMQLQLAQFGLTTDELQNLSDARLRDAAAALDRRAALAADVDLSGQLSQLYREQASALRETADVRAAIAAKERREHDDPTAGLDRALKDYMADIKRAGDATYGAVSNSMKGLEDLGVTALSGGKVKSAARQWVNGIISEMERLYIIKPLIASIAGGGSGSGSSGWFGAASSLLRGYFSGGLSIDTSGYSANGGLGYASAAGISGGRASGGGVDAGKSYLVGEKGPEVLRMGGQSGTVIPNDAIGGGTKVDNRIGTVNVGAGVTRGEMYSAIQAATAQQEMRQRRLSRQGNWA